MSSPVAIVTRKGKNNNTITISFDDYESLRDLLLYLVEECHDFSVKYHPQESPILIHKDNKDEY